MNGKPALRPLLKLTGSYWLAGVMTTVPLALSLRAVKRLSFKSPNCWPTAPEGLT